MNAAIVHRGPDHGAVASYGRCVLGYRRLSIIDLATGDQPVENEQGSVAAVFNGEIYNFRELRRELEARGHQIPGTGDSPLIPHAYEEWGLDFAEPPRRDVRDRALGPCRRAARARPRPARQEAAPATPGSRTARSRSPRRRRRSCGCRSLPRELDLQQLDAYLALQYVPRSGLQAVEKVPPGSLVVAEGGALRVERYWRPRPASGPSGRGGLDRARARAR